MATATTSYLGLNTFTKKVVFYGYIAFWVTQNMLVYAFRKHRHHINFTTVAGLIEMTKLVFSLVPPCPLQSGGNWGQHYFLAENVSRSVEASLYLPEAT